ncbi:hypothetical protein Z043_107935 [Scleropages formosus]|uniref:G-protein coupled receptors family 1 profile domain-containing protein n=1 Tax=Scleropages formosus TaxID=113540 RepID=A0A0P7VHQ3_SCLFO|nr:hypothetical protein Z043_107935 [Scleropages formosus]
MESEVNGSCAACASHGPNQSSLAARSPSAGVTTALASVLIFTIVVDILGNLLVILSVFRNKKLRNAVTLALYDM